MVRSLCRGRRPAESKPDVRACGRRASAPRSGNAGRASIAPARDAQPRRFLAHHETPRQTISSRCRSAPDELFSADCASSEPVVEHLAHQRFGRATTPSQRHWAVRRLRSRHGSEFAVPNAPLRRPSPGRSATSSHARQHTWPKLQVGCALASASSGRRWPRPPAWRRPVLQRRCQGRAGSRAFDRPGVRSSRPCVRPTLEPGAAVHHHLAPSRSSAWMPCVPSWIIQAVVGQYCSTMKSRV